MTRCNVSHPGNRCKERPQTLSGGKRNMSHQKATHFLRGTMESTEPWGKMAQGERAGSSGQQKARQWGLERPARGSVRPRDPFGTPARTQKRWPPLKLPTRREQQAGLSVVPAPARASYL
ncbi:hypothetical protein IscW_ISCW017339 [Ixodes scapularis]|uniref:Uncharacterized protein n=1 Tax=Ixodes scapularis TaxID=6945 RepID=B7P939_IXOSC|nr:hypothetical protein IscW_ISCW017339 [Ixodes scapularis]|eukprot:XP_002403579.1 hypothetical protein IscW_ISCW017339 [Ixodes scapularis]